MLKEECGKILLRLSDESHSPSNLLSYLDCKRETKPESVNPKEVRLSPKQTMVS